MIHIPRAQLIAIIGIILAGILFAAPNLLSRDFLDRLPSWLPTDQVNLGLDLRGGSHLLLEVDVEGVFQEQLSGFVDSVRVELRRARIGYTGLGLEGHSVVFQLRDQEDIERAREVLRDYIGDARLRSTDDGQASITLTDEAMAERRIGVVQQSIEIVRRRIDETGTREPTIQRQGEDRILIQLPGVDDPERVKDLLGQTARKSFHLVDDDVVPGVDPVPPGSSLLPARDQGPGGQPLEYVIRNRVMVSGDNLVDAQATFQEGQPVVSFRFDSIGAQRFGDATRNNVGRLFAIVLDDEIISAPVIREPILGGRGVISGSFTTQEAQDLALLLRAGALPAELLVLEERSVGPGLGADSIAAGEFASVLGMVLVVVFMIAVYGLFGTMASAALVINLILLLAAPTALQATLTLPGIAGIVLTIGMAVDANVLVFERIREEVRNGRGPVSAIDYGYREAMSAIIDANLTTLIAALILYQFGTGPIRGFAVTLSIGLVTSMFTAIMVTRLFMVSWLRAGRPKKALPI